MITIKPNNMEGVIELELEGKIQDYDIKEFEDYFNQKKKDHDEINLLMTVNDMSYSLDGLVEDLKFDIKHWKQFNKIAVLSDKKWVEISTKMIQYLPKVEVEHFNHDEKDKAKEWLN